jgi:hypothetical protein
LLVLLVLLVILVINFDWNRARPWINQQVSEATGRHFAKPRFRSAKPALPFRVV